MTHSRTLQAAIEYADLGWHVIDIPAGQKGPVRGEWQHKATTETDTLDEWFGNRTANIGILMGPRSGIIDVESDDDDAENLLRDLFGGVMPDTPTYRASRGNHRLFRFTDQLPVTDKGVFKIGNLEFRTGCADKGIQSVAPPSRHPSGAVYEWLPGLSHKDCEPAEIPDSVIAKIAVLVSEGPLNSDSRQRKPEEHWDEISEGVAEGNRNNAAAEYIGKLFQKCLPDPSDSETVKMLWRAVKGWNRANRPPLGNDELKRTFKSILKMHRANHSGNNNGDRIPIGWGLKKVNSEPTTWLLRAPLWKGEVELTDKEMHVPRNIAFAVLNQLQQYVDKKRLNAAWADPNPASGTGVQKSLPQMLVETAPTVESAAETKRSYVLAEYLWGQVCRARELNEPDQRGRMTWVDGEIWFRFEFTLTEMRQCNNATIGNREFSRLLKHLGAKTIQRRVSDQPLRFKVLEKDHLHELKRMAIAT